MLIVQEFSRNHFTINSFFISDSKVSVSKITWVTFHFWIDFANHLGAWTLGVASPFIQDMEVAKVELAGAADSK